MDFKSLNEHIPHVIGKKEKVLSVEIYPNVTLRMPGRHQKDTAPPGGDFVVVVNDKAFGDNHSFTHIDLFNDLEKRLFQPLPESQSLIHDYLKVIRGDDPLTMRTSLDNHSSGLVMNRLTYLCAAQCLAVAEHRRYAHFEKRFGGRYLPFRFSAGIAEGLWTAGEAAQLQRRGRPGVEQLENTKGCPVLTKELMS